MKRILLFLIFGGFLAGSLRAGESIAWTPATSGRGLIGSSAWSGITNFQLEIQCDTFVSQSATVGLWEVDSNVKIYIDSTNHLGFSGFHGEGGSLPLNGATDFRAVFQRNTASGNYSLELWNEQTGAYSIVTVPDSSPSAVTVSNYHYSIGSFYEPANPNIHIGMLRAYSAARPLGGQPPLRSLTSGYGDLMDFEFEGNFHDQGNWNLGASFALLTGTVSYVPTLLLPPAVSSASLPLSGRAGQPVGLAISSAFANADSPVLQYLWQQVTGPSAGIWSSNSIMAPQFTPPTFGTYNLQASITDTNNLSTLSSFELGAVATDSNNVVMVPNSKVNSLLGPMVRVGANPWSWFDNRFVTAANTQIMLQAPGQPFDAWWLESSNKGAGTISCTGGGVSATCTGSGTRFQTDFCNGGTSPQNGGTGIVINYPSSIYSGQTGYAHYSVTGCPSQTSITLNTPFSHTTANLTNAQYAEDPSGSLWSSWSFSSIPANYYDNVLAFYHLYYSTGLTSYLTAARTLASRWFSGPVWDSGMSFNINQVGGCCIVAGPGRGISPAGVVLWGLESGANIWPGIRFLWSYEGSLVEPNVLAGQIGDIRDASYISAIPALCVLYDPAPPAGCATNITNAVENWWAPLERTDKSWTNTQPGNALYAGGSISVTVTHGSTGITLNNATWNCSSSGGTFYNPNWNGGTANLNAFLWFFNNPTNPYIPGNTSGVAGDQQGYTIASCTDTTHAILSEVYQGTSGNKGLVVSAITAFGTQPFMAGVNIGLWADWMYRAFQTLGQPSLQAIVKSQALDFMSWLSTTGTNSNSLSLYGARTFLNCEGLINQFPASVGWTPNNDPSCAQALAENGEAMHAVSALYSIAPSPSLLSYGNAVYNAMFCKPTGGWTCNGMSPGGLAPFYDSYVDDYPTGFQITIGPGGQANSLTNKWFGYYFGIGFGGEWPAVAVGGLAPQTNRTLAVNLNFGSVPHASQATVTVIKPDGSVSSNVCSASPCVVVADAREGSAQIAIQYESSAGAVLASTSLPLLLGVQ